MIEVSSSRYNHLLSSFPSLMQLGKGMTKTKHITLYNEQGLRMRVDVDSGEIVMRETKEGEL